MSAVEQMEQGEATSAMAGLAVVDRWSGPTALYTEAVEWAGNALGASHTLQGKLEGEIWKELAELGLRGKRSALELPAGVTWDEFNRAIPGCRAIKKIIDARVIILMWAWPRWLMKGGNGCNEMVINLYTKAGSWSIHDLARLGDPEDALWGDNEKLLAKFI